LLLPVIRDATVVWPCRCIVCLTLPSRVVQRLRKEFQDALAESTTVAEETFRYDTSVFLCVSRCCAVCISAEGTGLLSASVSDVPSLSPRRR
jgi:hypothetical protein